MKRAGKQFLETCAVATGEQHERGLKPLKALFYPCDNLTQTIFHLLFRFHHESEGGKQDNEEGWERC